MPLNKISRRQLKGMLVDILSKSATFKMLGTDKEVNPCRISFDGMEFYIYVKNLSPAQLSNGNPDIWRVQLPVREDFNQLKVNPVPFVVLGYDDENKVFTTWNPYWVKQRLNAAKSVSLYSRLALQAEAAQTLSFLRQSLNNDGEVIAFPCSKLGYFLVNIKQFFPEMTDYVAMGSRRRAEANAAYRCLCDSKNIAGYAKHLARQRYSDESVGCRCKVIKRLISGGYFSRNRKVFLACDSLAEYPSVIDAFIRIPEVVALEEVYHHQISDCLRTYIQYLLQNNGYGNGAKSDSDGERQKGVSTGTRPSPESIDWETSFTDSNGKLTRIANPLLIDKLRPVLDTEYRKTATAYRIISEFYGDRFNAMELKDWADLINQIDWKAPYSMPE